MYLDETKHMLLAVKSSQCIDIRYTLTITISLHLASCIFTNTFICGDLFTCARNFLNINSSVWNTCFKTHRVKRKLKFNLLKNSDQHDFCSIFELCIETKSFLFSLEVQSLKKLFEISKLCQMPALLVHLLLGWPLILKCWSYHDSCEVSFYLWVYINNKKTQPNCSIFQHRICKCE